jgi:hypothetical protein
VIAVRRRDRIGNMVANLVVVSVMAGAPAMALAVVTAYLKALDVIGDAAMWLLLEVSAGLWVIGWLMVGALEVRYRLHRSRGRHVKGQAVTE